MLLSASLHSVVCCEALHGVFSVWHKMRTSYCSHV